MAASGGALTRHIDAALDEFDPVLVRGVTETAGDALTEVEECERSHAALRAELARAGHVEQLPVVDHRHAQVLLQAHEPERALQAIMTAADGYRAAGRDIDAMRTSFLKMEILDELGRHEEAVTSASDALDAIDRGLADGTFPREDCTIGHTRARLRENVAAILGFLGRHDDAIAQLEDAVAAYAALGLTGDANRARTSLGIEAMKLGRLPEAEAFLRLAQGRFAVAGDEVDAAICQTHRGTVALRAGRFDDAKIFLDAAVVALTRLEAGTERARALAARASVDVSLGLIEEAIAGYEAAAEFSETVGLDADLAYASFGLGVALSRQGRDVDACDALERALALFTRERDHPMAARALLAMAEISDDPVSLVLDACQRLDPELRPADAAFARLRLASLGVDVETNLNQAAALATRRCSPHLDWRVSLGLAVEARRDGRTEDALVHAQVAVDIVDAIQGSAPCELLRDSFAPDRRAPSMLLASICVETGDIARAAEVADRVRPMHRHLPPTTTEAQPQRLDDLYTDLLRRPETATRTIRTTIRTLEHRESVPPEPVPAFEQTVVVFQRHADRFVCLLRRLGTWTTVPMDLHDAELAAATDSLGTQWRQMTVPGLADRHRDELLDLAAGTLAELEARLWAPLARHLPPMEPVVVVADSVLASVPFHAFDANHDRVVSVSTSVGLADALADRPPLARRALVFAVPDLQAPAVGEEAQLVAAAHCDVTVRLGVDATYEALVSHLPSAGVVHLASHGLHRSDNPRYSAVRLGDLWLTAARAEALRLDGQLVVLSACDVGMMVSDGPSPIGGLPRALLAAGASAVIAAAWPVDDEVTAELMAELHQELAGGVGPAMALHRARLAVAKAHPHPYYWAAFQLVGATDARC